MRRHFLFHFLAVFTVTAASLFVLTDSAAAAEPRQNGRSEAVQFARGATATAITGELKGEQYVDYLVQGGANQTLAVTLKPGNAQNYFNIIPPGATEAMFIGSTSGNQSRRVLPADGTYTIRVYLMRAAARRNETSSYALNIALEGRALAPIPAAKDAIIRGTPFHASANIACMQPGSAQPARCDAYIIRRGFDGTGTVEVSGTGGFKRNILLVKMQPMASDSREPLSFVRKGDIISVGVGNDERVDIPEALVTGG